LPWEKTAKQTPFIQEAKALPGVRYEIQISRRFDPKSLRNALLTAAGLSDKALTHLTAGDKDKALKEFIDNFLKPAGLSFIDELVYRFLLTRGDTLGE